MVEHFYTIYISVDLAFYGIVLGGIIVLVLFMRVPRRGGRGSAPPPHFLLNHKNIGFLSNTGLDPLKAQKATKPAFIVGLSSGVSL